MDNIINAINTINQNKYNRNDAVIKKLFKYIFNEIGNYNIGAFEFIYDYAINGQLMQLNKFLQDNNYSNELIEKSLEMPRIEYRQKENELLIFINQNKYNENTFLFLIDMNTKSIEVINIIEKYFLNSDKTTYDTFSFFPNTYKYYFNNNVEVEVQSFCTNCKCLFNQEGIMIKKELNISYNKYIYEYLSKIITFLSYYREIGNVNKMAYLLENNENLLEFLSHSNDSIKAIFERDKEIFVAVHKKLFAIIENNIIYEQEKEEYINPLNRLYDLNNFIFKCLDDNSYLKNIEKEENNELKQVYLRRLRSLE